MTKIAPVARCCTPTKDDAFWYAAHCVDAAQQSCVSDKTVTFALQRE
jgi:hypothetical protein